jgi:BlaI family penicillinase repressor
MSDKSELQITDAEWEVMLSVWEADDQTPGEIIARVQPLRGRSHRTVRTLLSRLVDKGAVSVRVHGVQHLYSAAVTRDACVRAAAESFSARFFAGSLRSLLLHFVENESLSDDELMELRQRLDSITRNPAKKSTSKKARAKPDVQRRTKP